MSVLVIAEHNNQAPSKSTYATIAAANKLADTVDLAVLGHNAGGVAEKLSMVQGVKTILHADDPIFEHSLAESFTPAVLAIQDQREYEYLLAPASTFGKNLMPRIAALLDTQQVSDIISIEAPDTFKRPIYAGNVIATVQSSDNIRVITVRPTAFDPLGMEGGSADIQTLELQIGQDKSSFVEMKTSGGERPELTSAPVVVSGGRGVGSADDFKLIEELADTLAGAVGASRAAVDAGYVPNDYQVGQTGKVVAPDLYIAVGISGAIQHLAGMTDSKVIVAINKDPDAPIFQVADYGLVADLFEVLPDLTQKLKAAVD
jgi:electron transfer flavoprotein alpha subunit